MKQVTIQQALQYVADHPDLETDELITLPAHELVCRTLFEIANGASLAQPRSMPKANAAREIIFLRLVGRRRAGSHPATRTKAAIQFADLTGELGK